jgi:beta-phosphoglucomutase-like phosphatase (HAD superfamily)
LYRALLFDLDGTLAETDSVHLPTWVDVLRPHGIEIDERFFRENFSGRSNSKIVEDLSPHLSDEVGSVKPDPAPYRTALEKLGVVPEEALAFEDSTSGITSAAGAGIPTIGIASTQAPETLEDAGTFMVAEDFADPKLRNLLDLPGAEPEAVSSARLRW